MAKFSEFNEKLLLFIKKYLFRFITEVSRDLALYKLQKGLPSLSSPGSVIAEPFLTQSENKKIKLKKRKLLYLSYSVSSIYQRIIKQGRLLFYKVIAKWEIERTPKATPWKQSKYDRVQRQMGILLKKVCFNYLRKFLPYDRIGLSGTDKR